MKRIRSLILATTVLCLASSISLGCDCVQVGSPDTEKWLKESKGAIFSGEVITIEEVQVLLAGRPDDFLLKRKVTFKVLKRWKGARADEMVITTGVGGGDCGIRFVEGLEYLIDANEINGTLETGICSFTQRVSDAIELIKALDRIVADKQE